MPTANLVLGPKVLSSIRRARKEGPRSVDREQCAATQTPEHSGYCLQAYLEKLLREQAAPTHFTEPRVSTRAGHVTLEDVRRARDRLKAVGAKVSSLTLLAEIGRGNKGTICKHYATLKAEDAPAASGMLPPISPALLGEIAHEIESQVKARTISLSSELEDVQKALEAVAAESEAFSAEASEAESRASALQLSLAEHAGAVEELRAQNKSLATQLSALRDDAERARQSLAIAQDNLRVSEDRVARLEADKDRARIEVSDARTESTKLREQLEARTHECISLRANAEIGREVAASVEQAFAKTALLQTNLEEARSRLASSEAQRQGMAERLKDAQGALNRAEATCEQLLQKVLQSASAVLDPNGSDHPIRSGERREAK